MKLGTMHPRVKDMNTGPISTKLGTMHPRVKGIQVCPNEGPAIIWLKYCQYGIKTPVNQSNEGPHPFPRGDSTLCLFI